MSAFADFHFLRPAALLLLIALPLCWYAWRHGRSDAGAWRAAVDAHLLPHLIERIDGGSGRGGLALAAVLWTLACLALAGPAWEREPMPLYRNQAARVLVLELAPSMLAQDVKPSRLERARYKIDDILARSRDYQTALLGYAGDAFVAAPLTDDVETVKNLVEALDPSTMPVPGNATARAIEAAVALIEQAGLHHGEIILLADGASQDATSAARKAYARGFEVSVLGLGTDAGAPVALAQGDFLKDEAGNLLVSRIDEPALRAVAAAGGGRYAPLSADAGDIDSLLAAQAEIASRGARDGSDADSARWKDRGPWLLLAMLPLALAGFRRGWLMAFVLASTIPRTDAQAASLADLWQRPDQQAAAALAAGDAKTAAEVAPTAEWRGSAAYRAGDFTAAESAYAGVDGADGAYNRGNALAKLGRYEEAIAAYDEALKRAPDMDDAQANRKAVEDFLKQRKQQDPQNQQGQQNPSQDGEQQQGQPKDDSGSKDGADKDPSQKQTEDGGNGQGGQQEAQDGASKDAQSPDKGDTKPDGQDGSRKDDGPANGSEGKAAEKPDAAQQQALKQQLDSALAGKEKAGDHKGEPVAAANAQEDDATREKRQALEHWLERVPDDPGGLLRRKFQLEYQRRQQRGGDGG